jgi:hypothetical protein
MARDETFQTLEDEVAALRVEVEQLSKDCYAEMKRAEAAEAIVAKLPKTADGVPIVPVVEFWIYDNEEGAFKYRAEHLAVLWYRPKCVLSWVQDDCHGMTYSTREAAQAAAKAVTK